jgi:hypothetical protein
MFCHDSGFVQGLRGTCNTCPSASARRYQRTRLYTRIALGKAMAMDVVSGESSGNFGQLLLL